MSDYKSILVLLTGTDADPHLLQASLELAETFGANIECLFSCDCPAGDGAFLPTPAPVNGIPTRDPIASAETKAETRTRRAMDHYAGFRNGRDLIQAESGALSQAPLVSLTLSTADESTAVIDAARRNDLILMQRPRAENCIPHGLHEALLLDSGRPVLLIPDRSARLRKDTVMVCWNRSAATTRAISAAMPILLQAAHVVLVYVDEDEAGVETLLQQTKHYLYRHGVRSVTCVVADSQLPTMRELWATAYGQRAQLLVMGASIDQTGAAAVSECTPSVLRSGPLPVLIAA